MANVRRKQHWMSTVEFRYLAISRAPDIVCILRRGWLDLRYQSSMFIQMKGNTRARMTRGVISIFFAFALRETRWVVARQSGVRPYYIRLSLTFHF